MPAKDIYTVARGVLYGDYDGYVYDTMSREGQTARALAKEVERTEFRVRDLEAELKRLRPLQRAFNKQHRAYCCPACNHVLLTDQAVAAEGGS